MAPDTLRPLTEHPDNTTPAKTSHAMSSAIAHAAETNIRQHEWELRLAVDTIPGLVWSALPDGHIDFLNQRWREYTGLTLAQASGWGWRGAIHPEDLPGLENYWRGVLASGKPGEMEARLRRFDGAYRWFLFRAVPLRDEWGNLVKWYGTTTDIDDRKRAEEQVRRSEAYLAEAQKLSRVGSFSIRLESRELVCSEETLRIGGWEPGTKPSLEKVLERVHPDDRPWVQTKLEQAMHDGSLLEYEHRLLFPDGSIRHVHTVARTMRDASNALEFVGAVVDITERKNSQDALRSAKARFEGILDIADDAIVSVDASQHIVLFNRGAEKVFGYTTSEVMGKPLDILLPQRFAGSHRGHIEEFATAAEVSRSMAQRREVFGRRKDRTEFPAEASISKLNLGNEVVFTVILRDITDRKRTAEALRASEHLARGQLEALKQAMAALSQESEPEKFLEHVLCITRHQLGAHSISVWEMNDTTGCVDLVAVSEDGRLQLSSKEEGQTPPHLQIETEAHPVWTEFFRTGEHCVYGEIVSDPPGARVATDPHGPWYDWLGSAVANPNAPEMIRHLSAAGIVATLCIPMFVAGKVTGMFSIRFNRKRPFRHEEIELTRAMAHQAMLAIQLMRLSQQSREAAVMAERNRLARDIHDTLAQGFTGVIVQLEAAADAKAQGLAQEADEHLGRAADLARESLREARRSVRALRPQALEEKSLCDALRELLHKMTAGTGLKAAFEVTGQPQPLPSEWEENLLRIGQEVLTNALRHAQASEFTAQLRFGSQGIHLALRDDGRGFDPGRQHDGFGLLGMRERVEGMGGQLTVKSAARKGTTIAVALPLAEDPRTSRA